MNDSENTCLNESETPVGKSENEGKKLALMTGMLPGETRQQFKKRVINSLRKSGLLKD